MYSRNHTIEDYPIFCEWWTAWNWGMIPYEFLPQNSVVICAPEPMCAVFLYRTDTPIVWAENYISSKVKDGREKAMCMLLEHMKEKVKEMGSSVIMSSVRHNLLARRLECDGFVKADTGLTNYIRVI